MRRRRVTRRARSHIGQDWLKAVAGLALWGDETKRQGESRPGGPVQVEPRAAVVVTVPSANGHEVDLARLDALVAAVKPAHVVHRVQVQRDV